MQILNLYQSETARYNAWVSAALKLLRWNTRERLLKRKPTKTNLNLITEIGLN